MSREQFHLSRRKALAALSSIGVASVGAGIGTSALFTDQESFENNRLVAGELDMRVGFEEHYANWSVDETDGLNGSVSMSTDGTVNDSHVGLPTQETINGSPLVALQNASEAEQFLNNTAGDSPDVGDDAQDTVPQGFDAATAEAAAAPCDTDLLTDSAERPVIRLTDLKPGDFGEVTISFVLCDNPGFVWATAELLTATENGTTEPEADDPDEVTGSVELLDAIQTAIWIDDGNNYQNEDESPAFAGTLREALDGMTPTNGFGNVGSSGDGLLLPGNAPAETAGGRGGNCFTPNETHSLVFAWWLPIDHANEVQSDAVTFDIGLYTEQCRHNVVGESASRPRESGFFETEPFVTQPTSTTVRLTASEQSAGETITADIPPLSVAADPPVDLTSVGITFGDSDALEITISEDQAPDDESLPSGFDPLGFFSIDHPSPPDSAIDEAQFGLLADHERLESPHRLTLLRYDPSTGWTPIRTRFNERVPAGYQYEAYSPGFSTFAAVRFANQDNPLQGTVLELPEGVERTNPDINAVFENDDAIEVSGVDQSRTPPVVDLKSVAYDNLPIRITDAFTIMNTSGKFVGFALSTSSKDVKLTYDDSTLVPLTQELKPS
jgi:predicted ribosomally synthesized peptide with SipW-like signal peptide